MNPSCYTKAPITEAILDLRVNPREGLTMLDISRAMQGEESAYSNSQEMIVAQGRVELGEHVTAAASQRQVGYLRSSSDQKYVIQTRNDGFTFSRLAPYENWESFRDEARRLWDLYRKQVAPTNVIRLAVRYVNRFDLPGPIVDLKDYFYTYPEVSAGLTQPLGNFFLRLAIEQVDLKGQLLINQTLVPAPENDCLSVILDIDLFREVDIPDGEEEIWHLFDLFRERKNQVFEACITEQLRELIR